MTTGQPKQKKHKKVLKVLAALMGIFLLTGCLSSEPTVTPDIDATVEAFVQEALDEALEEAWTPPALTPRLTKTPYPTFTPQPTTVPTLTPTPKPTRTPRPTKTPSPTMSQEESQFHYEMGEWLGLMREVRALFGEAHQLMIDDATYLHDEEWKRIVRGILETGMTISTGIRRLEPPPAHREWHSLVVEANEHYETFARLYITWIDTLDTSLLVQATEELNLCTDLINQATEAMPIPTNTPRPTNTATPAFGRTEAQVVQVVDGDTIKVEIDGTIYTVRYIGIDTPETVHPSKPVQWMGPEASEANKRLVEGQTVYLEKDVSETDRYGRLLCYVFLADGLFVNAELVRLGYAQVSTYPPDVHYQDLFLEMQQEAREAEYGLWGPTPTPPPLPTATSIPPTVPPVVQPTQSPQSTIAPTEPPPPATVCDCSGNVYNCSDFTTHAQAQACYDYCISQGCGDIHKLDRDNDGIACESLP